VGYRGRGGRDGCVAAALWAGDSRADRVPVRGDPGLDPSIGARYHFGVDGVSALLGPFPSTTVITLIAILSAWTSVDKRPREFYGLLLALEAGMLGRSSRSTCSSSTYLEAMLIRCTC